MQEKVWRKRNSPTLLVGMQIGQPLWRTIGSFLQKLKIEVTYDPAIPLPEALLRASLTPKQYHMTNLDDVG